MTARESTQRLDVDYLAEDRYPGMVDIGTAGGRPVALTAAELSVLHHCAIQD